jgi:hypothetical protein
MLTKRFLALSLALVSLCTTLVSGPTLVLGQETSKRACVRDANVTHRLCNLECNRDHEDELLICSAGSNETLSNCYQGCATDRDSCLQPYRDQNLQCHDSCFDTFDTAIQTCNSSTCLQGDLQCKICRLTAKLDRFECAKTCQLTFNDGKDERQACRKTFRQCLKSCRKASTN